MEALGWRRRRRSSPAARRGARQRAGLTPASASNTLPCQRETPSLKKLRPVKKSLDSDHGIYRDPGPRAELRAGLLGLLHPRRRPASVENVELRPIETEIH
jgi:hypothetical protein